MSDIEDYRIRVKKYAKRKEKPKIAICLFGHMRTYKLCAPFLDHNVASYYDTDIFIHSWQSLDHQTQTWHDYQKTSGDVAQHEIKSFYPAIKTIHTEEQNYQELGKMGKFSIFGIKSMFYSMRSSLNLAAKYAEDNNIEYEYVLFTRPDIWFKTPFIFEELLDNKINLDSLIATCSSEVRPNCEKLRGLDLIFYSNLPTMLKLYQYEEDELIDWCKEISEDNPMPEKIFLKLLQSNKIEHIILKYKYVADWTILRDNKIFKKKIIGV